MEQLHFQTITNKLDCALYAGEHDLYTLGISLPLFEVIEDRIYEMGFLVGEEVKFETSNMNQFRHVFVVALSLIGLEWGAKFFKPISNAVVWNEGNFVIWS